MQVRRANQKNFAWRNENEWPLARTKWTKYYFDSESTQLAKQPPKVACKVTYRGLSDGITFLTPPLAEETEITGPIAVRLFVSSETNDADIFIVVRVFTADLREIVFPGHIDPNTPIAQGWLRASHREIDSDKSLPHRPYHTHKNIEKLTPGEIYQLDIEVLPTCIVIPQNYRLGVTVRGCDYISPNVEHTREISHLGSLTGVGLFRHDDPKDRPSEIFDGNVTISTGPDHQAFLLLPVVPGN